MMVEWSDSEFVHPLRCVCSRFCTLDFSKPVDDFEPAKQRGVASVAQNRCNANAANNHGDSSTFTVKVVEVVSEGSKCCLKMVDQVDQESSRVDWPE
ncbi:hypothetical protein M514_10518 [Trichuris suis]|uniref:Uncharacterized protein n=1 Tax=Trichuris suis TaxID=68888 RepID=A0A085LUD8_9BILA|nr:hypothetical protein M513_10518 [Trichuris suis]KFD63972.1 hypothetical protein M514_10518 [Trichuris suis]